MLDEFEDLTIVKHGKHKLQVLINANSNINGNIGNISVNNIITQRKGSQGLESIRKQLLIDIETSLKLLTDEHYITLNSLPERLNPKRKANEINNNNNFYQFNFDDLEPFVPLELTIDKLRYEKRITNNNVGNTIHDNIFLISLF